MNDQSAAAPEAVAPGIAKPAAEPDKYAIVEIFGHRQHYGRVSEVEQFGAKMLRVDVPINGDFANGFVSHHYGGAAIFSFCYTDLETVKAHNAGRRPPGQYQLTFAGGGEEEPADGDFDEVEERHDP